MSKLALFLVYGLKDEKLIKKQTYMKTETCKLYSEVFWIFLPNFIKIDPYNFELYRFKVGAFFLRHSVCDRLYDLQDTTGLPMIQHICSKICKIWKFRRTAGPLVPYCMQWWWERMYLTWHKVLGLQGMATDHAAVPLAHANQLPLPRLQSAGVHESSHVSSAISSIQTFTLTFMISSVHRLK